MLENLKVQVVFTGIWNMSMKVRYWHVVNVTIKHLIKQVLQFTCNSGMEGLNIHAINVIIDHL